MRILHTEASPGWGGQEIRILREALGMRARGHTVLLAVRKGALLADRARREGLQVYELPFKRKTDLRTFWALLRLIRREKIDLINTHSSRDSWLAGMAARLMRRALVRTRHCCTASRPGINSFLLYRGLADQVVTTCEETRRRICLEARLSPERCHSIPTGLKANEVTADAAAIADFRQQWGIAPTDCLVGTACVLRYWKGISHLMEAAKILEARSDIRWMVVGAGVSHDFFMEERRQLGLEEKVIFTGHLDNPHTAIAAMDIFTLLSLAHEGVSQSSLQAAHLSRPLITTPIGGLGEVCIPGVTGLQVPLAHPKKVAEAVVELAADPERRAHFGKAAHELVASRFTFDGMIDAMEAVYSKAATVALRPVGLSRR